MVRCLRPTHWFLAGESYGDKSADRKSAGIVSAPLWDSRNSTFAGLLTSTDYINVIQYYCQFPDEIDQVDQFRLSSLRGRSCRQIPG